jgi:hypothetical protein
MAKYWVRLDISREDALTMLDELATPGHGLRTRLEGGKRSAKTVLRERGIRVWAGLPDPIVLPPADEIRQLHTHARTLMERDRQPFGFYVLSAVFGAMPLVDGAD